VSPATLTCRLYEHPAVAAAAVIGIPHDSLGEDVGAAVALTKGASIATQTRCATASKHG
jgi:acyl-coenzyme A synthetase/AMP-(fatty) acid ligase